MAMQASETIQSHQLFNCIKKDKAVEPRDVLRQEDVSWTAAGLNLGIRKVFHLEMTLIKGYS